jgi:hypothetical protein
MSGNTIFCIQVVPGQFRGSQIDRLVCLDAGWLTKDVNLKDN